MTHYHNHLPEATGEPEDPAVWIKPGEPDEGEREQLEGICLGSPEVDPELHEFNRITKRATKAAWQMRLAERRLVELNWRMGKGDCAGITTTSYGALTRKLSEARHELNGALDEYEKMISGEGGK